MNKVAAAINQRQTGISIQPYTVYTVHITLQYTYVHNVLRGSGRPAVSSGYLFVCAPGKTVIFVQYIVLLK